MHERDAFIEKSSVFYIDPGGAQFGRNAFMCYPRRHRPKDPHKDLCGKTQLHSQRLTQMHERSVQSHTHMQKHRDVHRDAGVCTEAERYTDPLPYGITKRCL